MEMSRLPISACFILKNEEEFLKAALESIAPWISELILCDSGSNDESETIARSFEKQVPRFEWIHRDWTDDYSAARNFTASQAKSPWILFIDGDEWLAPDAKARIEAAIGNPQIACYSLKQVNYSADQATEEALRLSLPQGAPRHGEFWATQNWMERLYRSDQGLSYSGRIHESLLPACLKRGLVHQKLEVTLHHFGRLKSNLTQKINYYLKLTELKLKEDPTNPAAWIEMAVAWMETQQFQKAFELAQIAFQKFSTEPEILKVAFQSALRTNAWPQAEKFIRDFLQLQPGDLYALSQLTTSLLYQTKFDELCEVGEKILVRDPQNFVTHVNLATYFFEIKDWNRAARHIASALKQRPTDEFLLNAMKKIPAQFQIH